MTEQEIYEQLLQDYDFLAMMQKDLVEAANAQDYDYYLAVIKNTEQSIRVKELKLNY